MQFKEPLTIRHIEEKKLMAKYPKIFIQQDLPVTHTAMCWGLDCGVGWYPLIDALCAQLQFDIDNNKQPQIEATQVKEKFGMLRFYVNGSTDRQEAMIDFAEYLSGVICELCGTFNDVSQNKSGWIQTLCKPCRSENG